MSQAMRVVRTRVFPDPAPARISASWLGRVTAASCSGLRLSSKVTEKLRSGRWEKEAILPHRLPQIAACTPYLETFNWLVPNLPFNCPAKATASALLGRLEMRTLYVFLPPSARGEIEAA